MALLCLCILHWDWGRRGDGRRSGVGVVGFAHLAPSFMYVSCCLQDVGYVAACHCNCAICVNLLLFCLFFMFWISGMFNFYILGSWLHLCVLCLHVVCIFGVGCGCGWGFVFLACWAFRAYVCLLVAG